MHAQENRVRTFRAKDPRSALAAVKATMGTEAVILSTREIPGGLFRDPQIEVTAVLASVEEIIRPPPPAPRPPAPMRSPPWASAALRKLAAEEFGESRDDDVDGPLPEPKIDRARESRYHEAQEQKRAARAERLDAAPDRDALEEVEQHAQRREKNQEAQQRQLLGEVQSLRHALEDAKSSIVGAARETREATRAGRDPELERLLAGGFEAPLAEQILRAATARAHGESGVRLHEEIRRELSARIATVRAPWLPGRRRIVALVGPPGVGKTTTLAKLAARALLMQSRLRVAMITIDNYRIGAREHLARYGEIMDVPTHVAKDAPELVEMVKRSEDADLVLIDTAGRSDPEAVARQCELTRAVKGVELHLVLSASVGAQQMAATVERYKSLQPERVVFTKLDEAVGRGSLLSAIARLKVPVSCVTDGQRVPEDVHPVTSTRLATMLLDDSASAQDPAQSGRA